MSFVIVCATPPYCFFNVWRWPKFSSPWISGLHIQSVSSPIFQLRRFNSVQSLCGSHIGSLGYDVCFVVHYLGFFSVNKSVAVNKLDGANQHVHWFLGGKGLGIQLGTSVWAGSPKSNKLWHCCGFYPLLYPTTFISDFSWILEEPLAPTIWFWTSCTWHCFLLLWSPSQATQVSNPSIFFTVSGLTMM